MAFQPQPVQDTAERYVVNERGVMRAVHDMTSEEALFVARQYEERARLASEKGRFFRSLSEMLHRSTP